MGGCCPCHVHDELWWVWNWLWNKLWNWLWNFHDDVPTVHATSACPDYGSPADDGSASTYADYGSPAVHATSACPDYCSPADDGSASTCADYGSPAVHSTSACPEFCSPADDGSAGTSPDYGSPAIHSTSTNACTNQHDERFLNQHDRRRFFRNSDSACLVTQERDFASCNVPR